MPRPDDPITPLHPPGIVGKGEFCKSCDKILRKFTILVNFLNFNLFGFRCGSFVVSSANVDELRKSYFDPTGVIKSWIVEGQGPPSMFPEELEKSNFLLIVDDGVTRGKSNALSLASNLGLYAQCTFGKNEDGEEELKILQPTQKERDSDQLPKVICAGHLFEDSEYRTIHICLPKIPIFFGNSDNSGLTENFIDQVSKLLGVQIGPKLIGVILVGLQADCKQLARTNFEEQSVTVQTLQTALGRKIRELSQAWNTVCRAKNTDKMPPLAVGVIGVPDSTLAQRVVRDPSGFAPDRLAL